MITVISPAAVLKTNLKITGTFQINRNVSAMFNIPTPPGHVKQSVESIRGGSISLLISNS